MTGKPVGVAERIANSLMMMMVVEDVGEVAVMTIEEVGTVTTTVVTAAGAATGNEAEAEEGILQETEEVAGAVSRWEKFEG